MRAQQRERVFTSLSVAQVRDMRVAIAVMPDLMFALLAQTIQARQTFFTAGFESSAFIEQTQRHRLHTRRTRRRRTPAQFALRAVVQMHFRKRRMPASFQDFLAAWATSEFRQHELHVLTGAQRVGGKVRARTKIIAPC